MIVYSAVTVPSGEDTRIFAGEDVPVRLGWQGQPYRKASAQPWLRWPPSRVRASGTPGGKRFLPNLPVDYPADPSMTVTLNWPSSLKR